MEWRANIFYVTPGSKVRLGVSLDTQKKRYEIDDTVVTGTRSSWDASGLYVKSLGEHWSAGVFLEAESSLYSNIDLGMSAAPAIEYNFFPYSQSTRRQLRLLYKLAVNPVKYREETIYGKTRETLFQESLTWTYEVKQPWGTISLNLEGSHYFHDFSKNRLELRGEVSLRVWRGLSFEIDGSYTRIRDQLALPRGGASYEEVLLRQKQIATGCDYRFSVGLNFTFGSTRSNVVNPRFGNGDRGISISM